MCNTKNGGWLNWLILDPSIGFISNYTYKKAKKKDQAAINAANQAAADQVEANKVANSVQSTEPAAQSTQDAVKKLATQKVPLNTSNTGATIGSQSSVGLNLGGY